jgi:hypothetical protein
MFLKYIFLNSVYLRVTVNIKIKGLTQFCLICISSVDDNAVFLGNFIFRLSAFCINAKSALAMSHTALMPHICAMGTSTEFLEKFVYFFKNFLDCNKNLNRFRNKIWALHTVDP